MSYSYARLNRANALPGVLALLLLLSSTVLSGDHRAGATVPTADLYASLVPELRDTIEDETTGQLPHYSVTATFTPVGEDPARIEGTTHLSFINFTPDSLDEVQFRLYPNSPFYEENGLDVLAVDVAGSSAAPIFGEEDSLMTIPLGRTLASGEAIDLTIDFISTIPSDAGDDYGMFSYQSRSDSYNLGYWQPLLAGWTAESGWQTGEIMTRGDPVFSNTAIFSVEFTAPSALVFSTTGVETDAAVNGESTTHTWESGPARDFVMVANARYTIREAMVNETLVRSFTTPDSEAASGLALEAAVTSLEFFNEHVGLYPYREFDVAEVALGSRAAGIEFPGMVYIAENLYKPESFGLVFTIVHEVAHQYFYNLIGNNQYEHAFLDESLANYTAVLYMEHQYGVEAAETAIDRYLTRSYLAALFGQSGDDIVDQPTAKFASDTSYGRIVYGKGALGMHAIRQEIGLDLFLTGLSVYLEEHRFGVAVPHDLLTTFERVSGRDLQALWSHWFNETNGTQDFSPGDVIEIG